MTEDFSRPPRLLTSEERKARDAARRADAEQAMREHEAAQKAFYANKERLKALRLARLNFAHRSTPRAQALLARAVAAQTDWGPHGIANERAMADPLSPGASSLQECSRPSGKRMWVLPTC